jgi:hypothetical protein
MATINVSSNVKQVERSLNDIARKQIPFATARALTTTANLVQARITRELPTIFDRPTPFTMRAIGVTPATKTNQTAVVFVKDAQAKYLEIEETGGTRTPAGVALVLPGTIKLNMYGNMPKGALQRAKAKTNVFVGTVHGVSGFWMRTKGGLKLLAEFKAKATYKPIFKFNERAEQSVKRIFPARLRLALDTALKTAK